MSDRFSLNRLTKPTVRIRPGSEKQHAALEHRYTYDADPSNSHLVEMDYVMNWLTLERAALAGEARR